MSRKPKFKFRLYVAADTQNAVRATANLTAFCQVHLPDRYDIEIVDVLREPKRALRPSPARSMIGILNETQLILETLGLKISQA
jgi:circadian clock protein KaiB